MYFKIDPYHEIEGALQLNTSVVIYASQDSSLLDFCTDEWISIKKDHSKLKNKYGVVFQSHDQISDVTGCLQG